ncbi:15543_t:CDS:10 [Entrophospora sp. SA101]|nr:15543_t:CDS:10 [Entrophospora sp. SA101]CAJ0845132.1 6275_t:CDS:10 [Entrophospora sp. SA101]
MQRSFETELLVDKYRPKKFLDLIGDENLHRQVMKWVKTWDFCVFNKNTIDEHDDLQDKWKRPNRKILLLAGPPGSGKTTLAHVVAHHCGYNPIEINASDDRTGKTVSNLIKDALESQSIVFNKKPSLIIIDEIDGVSSTGDQNFIKLLIDLISSSDIYLPNAIATKADDQKSNKKPKKRNQLLRPIICICNDQYAPVLRPLRTIAQVFQFKIPPSTIVANRLKEICKIEKISVDMRTLSHLAESADGDIRSCLNNLQILKGQNKSKTTNVVDLGGKDINPSLFKVWDEIFQSQTSKIIKMGNNFKFDEYGNPRDPKSYGYIEYFVSMISNNGDYEKLMQGCFENYLDVKVHNQMSNITKMSEWINLYDTLNTWTNTRQSYELLGYFPFPLINFHRYFASNSKQYIRFPKKDYENATKLKENENILTSVLKSLPPTIQCKLNIGRFTIEVLPYLLKMISPELVLGKVQFVNDSNKHKITRIVEIMTLLNLKYTNQANENGSYSLDPTEIQHNARRLVAQEVHKALIKKLGKAPVKQYNKKVNSLNDSNPRSVIQSTLDYFKLNDGKNEEQFKESENDSLST